MKTIHLCKFDPLADQMPELVTIIIDQDIGPLGERMSLEECLDFYERQADELVEALHRSLPQGTFDRVALKMFAKKMKQNLYRGQTRQEVVNESQV